MWLWARAEPDKKKEEVTNNKLKKLRPFSFLSRDGRLALIGRASYSSPHGAAMRRLPNRRPDAETMD